MTRREQKAFDRVLAALENTATSRILFVGKPEDVAIFVKEVKRITGKAKR